MALKRVDVLLVEQGLAPSRQAAQVLIMAGSVMLGEQLVRKSSAMAPADAPLRVLAAPKYVSRGGYKLEKALDAFGLSPAGCVSLDIGASTGGFTDCMLQHGAQKVYAVDVGYGQLHQRLREDERVIVLERTNARHLQPEQIDHAAVTFATMDVSFISVKLVLPALLRCVQPGAHSVVLVKPQFEAGAAQTKKGVVRDRAVHIAVLQDICAWSAANGFAVEHLTFSPITGPKGNIEFLLHLRSAARGMAHIDLDAPVTHVQPQALTNPDM